MEIRIHLGDEDRKRYEGCPEWLSVDPHKVSYHETIVLQKGVEIEGAVCSFDSANDWRMALSKGDGFAEVVLIWLGLRQADIRVPLGGVDADPTALTWEIIPDTTDSGEPGKEPSTPETTS